MQKRHRGQRGKPRRKSRRRWDQEAEEARRALKKAERRIDEFRRWKNRPAF